MIKSATFIVVAIFMVVSTSFAAPAHDPTIFNCKLNPNYGKKMKGAVSDMKTCAACHKEKVDEYNRKEAARNRLSEQARVLKAEANRLLREEAERKWAAKEKAKKDREQAKAQNPQPPGWYLTIERNLD